MQSLIEHRGDIHHLFPKEYLKGEGNTSSRYNSVANLAYMQTEINIKVGKLAPAQYMAKGLAQTQGGKPTRGGITDEAELRRNLKMHCIPDGFEAFLAERQVLMARKLHAYYKKL